MNIIRKYKLYRLGIIVDNDCLNIIKFIEDNILNLEKFLDPDYPSFIFYMKDGKCYLEYDTKNQYLYIRYEGIWDVFYKQFKLGDTEIQQIMKDIVEDHYKLKVKTTRLLSFLFRQKVEDHYKLKVKTTGACPGKCDTEVEDHYKLKVKNNILPNDISKRQSRRTLQIEGKKHLYI